ncbi:mannose-6-phosphate isomerase, class I [Trichococcus collinsii]|uniref:Mannose-6-phosphate isomerase n=1 Tax=Trichococcus collinsii TaxID=157076 RepID=A0AB38A3N1_9LACT|nr:mannose-6-phosphate isomerase, class I [Trichococcus collinsii]CZQ99226.1 mannose-6-phosphate isomerase type i [Trichococcus collinsii]SEA92886.1 mannose-6-phosphate isomerase [Trichococcus collinsii]
MTEALFLKPVFQEKIWGGNKLHTVFGFDLPSDRIGENWVISAHPHGASTIENGKFKGERLDDLWKNHPELFGSNCESVFPLLTKILDAKDDLSIQVHPNDAYAKEHEGELGKTECWYIIDAEIGAEIIYNHYARTKQELMEMIRTDNWSELLRRVPVKKGDFFYVPSGTIHAIGKGTLVLETQQSSDTTYRVYDYDRTDGNGRKRQLHKKQSVDVTTVPGLTPKLEIKTDNYGDSSIVTYLSNRFFNVYEWNIKGALKMVKKDAPFVLVTVVEGSGELVIEETVYPLQMGTSCILPVGIEDWLVKGNLKIIASEPGYH